jgi:hypothetical protein
MFDKKQGQGSLHSVQMAKGDPSKNSDHAPVSSGV